VTGANYEDQRLVRLRLITHNARLVDARKKRGITQVAMARLTGICQPYIHDIETLKRNPTEDEMIKIACVLEAPIDYLFPKETLAAVSAGVFSRRKAELNMPQVMSLTAARRQELLTDGGIEDVEEKIDHELLTEAIHEVVNQLAPREQIVLSLRFGLDGKGPKTLEHVGEELGLSRARILQIENKALRKLRHPSRASGLKEFL
jgi:RNA polymerase sigma factor (sigma-70 family)